MPYSNFSKFLQEQIDDLKTTGTTKGAELVVVSVKKATNDSGPRFYLDGFKDQEFIRMNSNSYLGLQFDQRMLRAEEEGAKKYGVGPGAVRFISGTYKAHLSLERQLAKFHGREDCMLNSSAYTTVLGVISTLTTPETILISDELNHNCIINAMKLSRPKGKRIYKHNNLEQLEKQIQESVGQCDHLIVVTDGVFSMRGDFAPLDKISEITKKYNDNFPKDIVLVVDDSHGAGAYGATGRGTEEITKASGIDILVATLGKAFGVNGGYVVANGAIIPYLREKNPFYIYTNPITPSETTTAIEALNILDSEDGKSLLSHLSKMTKKFEQGLLDLGYETIPSPHPIVPLLVRDTERTTRLVKFLRDNGVLATGLNYPVVPKGDETIRFQVTADHTPLDIECVLDVLKKFKEQEG
ncbi:MAG: aminotransferase class I/II-fold pyridoxal phosphate-dependent enzyme [candidate division Zixibacteria bacterium]|nr:aminotransferase class I/II-fold pyridoxal phosphate-dependent enzyme [candidate division Zixibacteria bacterium]